MKKELFIGMALIILNLQSPHAHSASDDSVIASPPFSLTDEIIKKRTQGINVGQLITSIIKAKPILKSAYETNDEFNTRQLKWEEKNHFGSIGVHSRVAVIAPAFTLPSSFSEQAVDIQYDAETEIMSVSILPEFECDGLMLSKSLMPKREYTARNGFGVKVKVLVVDEKRSCIQFGKNGKLTSPEQKYSFKVQRKSAENTKYTMQVAIIGKITAPYVKVEKSHETPTRQFPVEKEILTQTLILDVDSIWLFDTFSGAVLAKSEQK